MVIVTTHSLDDSLCKLLAKHVKNKLNHMDHEVTTEDLYAEKFEPALTTTERESCYNDSYELSNVAEQVSRLKEAEALILLFPTWVFLHNAPKGIFGSNWKEAMEMVTYI